ncbi:MAG: hypothetical protein ABI333_00930 [bacterium]
MRRNIATILCLTAVLGLVMVAGCKKKQGAKPGAGSSDMTGPEAGMKAPPKADMDPMDPAAGMQGTAVMRPVAAAPGKGRLGALPIPADQPIFSVFLKAARATPLYKKYEGKIKEMLTGALDKHKVLKSLVDKCKLNPLTNVDGVTLSHPLESEKPDDTIIIIWGSFDTGKLMSCMEPEMKAAKVEYKAATVAGKKGFAVKMKGEDSLVLALDAKTFAMVGGAYIAKATAVLEGKKQSVEDTALYKEGKSRMTADTVLAVLVPAVPAAITAKMPIPLLKGIKAAAAMISMPAGGFDLQAGVDLGDEGKAKQTAKALPMLLGIVKAKLGAVGAQLLQNLKVSSDKSWVKIALALDKATFEQVQGMVTKMLFSVANKGGGSAAAPAMKAK